jgi:hypothetical protein
MGLGRSKGGREVAKDCSQPGQPGHFMSSGGVDQSGRALLTITPPCTPEEPPPSQDTLNAALHYLHALLR